MRFKKIVKFFKDGNVCVCGQRGTGKDILIANVVARRNEPYVSNLDYGGFYSPLDFEKINIGENSYKNFISGNINFYEFPYARGSDIYISDVGVYLPAQYCNELNRDYPYLPGYFQLCRQTSHNNIHTNTQSLSRMWDKLREQASDTYIRCRKCFYIPIPYFPIVIQLITVYDKYESCLDKVQPCRISGFSLNPVARAQTQTYIDNFYNTHGSVKNRILIYRNKSTYDTYHFEKLLKGGIKHEKKAKLTSSKNSKF